MTIQHPRTEVDLDTLTFDRISYNPTPCIWISVKVDEFTTNIRLNVSTLPLTTKVYFGVHDSCRWMDLIPAPLPSWKVVLFTDGKGTQEYFRSTVRKF